MSEQRTEPEVDGQLFGDLLVPANAKQSRDEGKPMAPARVHEQLACLVVVCEPWTVENGFVTPTFKVKRNRVDEVFAARYEGWERSDQAVVWA